MTVELSMFTAVLIIFMVNAILEHLFNWWVRETTDERVALFVILSYITKTTLLIILLYNLLK